MTIDESALRTANDSGFPLQIAVQRQVTETHSAHGWSVRYVEHSWSNRDDIPQSGFIDIVLQDQHKATILVIECKRVRNVEWVFLHSDGRPKRSQHHAKGWISHYANSTMARFEWQDIDVYPACIEAEFCALRGQSASDRITLIERVGGELITATEALAWEERDYRTDQYENIRLYFNVIVTTADLKIGTFNPTNVSLTDGTLSAAEFESVPYLRFRKQLSTRPMRFSPVDYESAKDIAYTKQNTVFVVRADALPAFLREFNVPDSSLRSLRVG